MKNGIGATLISPFVFYYQLFYNWGKINILDYVSLSKQAYTFQCRLQCVIANRYLVIVAKHRQPTLLSVEWLPIRQMSTTGDSWPSICSVCIKHMHVYENMGQIVIQIESPAKRVEKADVTWILWNGNILCILCMCVCVLVYHCVM